MSETTTVWLLAKVELTKPWSQLRLREEDLQVLTEAQAAVAAGWWNTQEGGEHGEGHAE